MISVVHPYLHFGVFLHDQVSGIELLDQSVCRTRRLVRHLGRPSPRTWQRVMDFPNLGVEISPATPWAGAPSVSPRILSATGIVMFLIEINAQ